MEAPVLVRHGARSTTRAGSSAARHGHRPTAGARPADSGWYLTTRGLAVVMAGFVAALLLGVVAAVHAFVTISGTDLPESQRDAAVVMAQPAPGALPQAS